MTQEELAKKIDKKRSFISKVENDGSNITLTTLFDIVEKGLGGADYVHFSQRGVDIMGDRLAKAFDNMYTIYKMRKEIIDVQD